MLSVSCSYAGNVKEQGQHCVRSFASSKVREASVVLFLPEHALHTERPPKKQNDVGSLVNNQERRAAVALRINILIFSISCEPKTFSSIVFYRTSLMVLPKDRSGELLTMTRRIKRQMWRRQLLPDSELPLLREPPRFDPAFICLGLEFDKSSLSSIHHVFQSFCLKRNVPQSRFEGVVEDDFLVAFLWVQICFF